MKKIATLFFSASLLLLFNNIALASISSLYLPSSLVHIEDEAFADNELIQFINFPNSLQSIGNKAFANCINLRSITLPDNISSLGSDVFNGCRNLQSITIPDSLSHIANHALRGTPSNITIYGSSDSYAETYCDKRDILFLDPSKVNSYPYTIIFYSQNEIISKRLYTYGEQITVPLPHKNPDYSNTYVFSHWTDANDNTLSPPRIAKKDATFYASFTSIPIPYSRRFFTTNSNHRYYVNIPSAWSSSLPSTNTNYVIGTNYSDSFTIEIGHNATYYGRSTYEYLTNLRSMLNKKYGTTGVFDFNGYGTYYGISYDTQSDTYSKQYTFNMGALNSLFYIKADNMTAEQLGWFDFIASSFCRASTEEFPFQ